MLMRAESLRILNKTFVPCRLALTISAALFAWSRNQESSLGRNTLDRSRPSFAEDRTKVLFTRHRQCDSLKLSWKE